MRTMYRLVVDEVVKWEGTSILTLVKMICKETVKTDKAELGTNVEIYGKATLARSGWYLLDAGRLQ